MTRLFLTNLAIFCLVTTAPGQDRTLVEIRDLTMDEIRVAGFRLPGDQSVEIRGVAFRGRSRRDIVFTRAWILASATRQVVWEMEDADRKRGARWLMNISDTVDLPRGDYEVYYSTVPQRHRQEWDNFITRFWKEIFDDEDRVDYYREFREATDAFRLQVRGQGKGYGPEAIEELQAGYTKTAFIKMTALRDAAYERQGFEVKAPVQVEVYAVGEARKDGTFDYGWLMDADTRKPVWKMTYRDSEYAGGARKNRQVRRRLDLKPGRYVAIFATDDSHAFGAWNAAPPNDPLFWGLTLRVTQPSDLRKIRLYDYRDVEKKNVIVAFTRLRDNECRAKGFTLKRPLKVRIYAIGEGRRGEMFDYAWIVDAHTHQRVWEMDYYDTEHAGGGEKNRLYDGVIQLEKGSYILYAVTDDSHSYWEWNTAPPSDRDRWGVTLMATEDDFHPDDVEAYAPERDRGILARLVQMGDYEHQKAPFGLDKDSRVRIYAIGEGMRGRMYDYAWIEDENGKVVWEMSYRQTRHAGGADKNRLFDDVIRLPRGNYYLYYESDDSHSFGDWNAAPPYDPGNWGVTLYLVED